MALFTGKQASTIDKRDIRFSEVFSSSTLPKVPTVFKGYSKDFQNGYPGWSMFGNGPCDDGSIPISDIAANQGAGDCAWAGPAEETRILNKNAGNPVPRFTSLNILQQYSAYSGYDLVTGANDNGSNVRDVLNWRQNKGLIDADGGVHKIGIYVSLEPGNFNELRQALYLCDAVGMGINFPETAMNQYLAGHVWTPVKGSQVDGGHYIPVVEHSEIDRWTCITWAKAQQISNNFITQYCDEVWAYITTERYSKVTGETPEGYRDIDLERYISLL